MAQKALSNTGLLFTDRRDFYISPQMVKELWPDVTPFLTVMYSRGTRGTPDPDFKMFEHRSGFVDQNLTLGTISSAWASDGTHAGSVATAVVTAASGLHTAVDSSYIGLELQIYDATLATRKAVALITSVSAGAFSTGTITMTALGNPDSADDHIAALASTDVCYVIGNARAEGDTSPEAFSDELKTVWNSAQIFKTPVQITGTLYEAALRGYSNELARLRMEKMKEHKIQMERAFLFGVRKDGINLGASSTDTFGDNHIKDGTLATNIRTTYGIVSAIRKYGSTSGDNQNIFGINPATYKYTNLVEDSEKVFQYISLANRKVGFCGQQFLSYWSKVDSNLFKQSSGLLSIGPREQGTFGYNFRVLATPHGEIELVYAPSMRGPWGKYMVVVDPGNIEHVQYRAAKYQTNIKTDNAYDGVKDQYFNDEGVGINLIESHSLWYLTA